MATFLKLIAVSLLILTSSCKKDFVKAKEEPEAYIHMRNLVDTIGFAQYTWQMDSILNRMEAADKLPNTTTYKAAICPHDDYAYAGGLYNKTLSGIKAKTVVLIGVAHSARNYDLQDKLIFGSYDAWKGLYGPIKVSPLRDSVLGKIPQTSYVIHDDMMQLEHSLEAITPFLQKNNKDLEILPLLVPYNTFMAMDAFSDALAQALQEVMKEQHLEYGEDLAIVISNDAIHYGDADWGGKNMAPFGSDSIGNARAINKDLTIINECLEGDVSSEKIENFTKYTVQENDYKEYKWTWCGRYSTPFGLLTANKLNLLTSSKPLTGTLIDYRNSLNNPAIKVDDIKMGHTAPANAHHWVGYVGVAYK